MLHIKLPIFDLLQVSGGVISQGYIRGGLILRVTSRELTRDTTFEIFLTQTKNWCVVKPSDAYTHDTWCSRECSPSALWKKGVRWQSSTHTLTLLQSHHVSMQGVYQVLAEGIKAPAVKGHFPNLVLV